MDAYYAITSGEVILSLVYVRISQASVVSQTLAAPAEAPEAARLHAQPVVKPTMDSGADDRFGAAVSESSANSKVAEPSAIANPLADRKSVV